MADHKREIEDAFHAWSLPCSCLCLDPPIARDHDANARRWLDVIPLDEGVFPADAIGVTFTHFDLDTGDIQRVSVALDPKLEAPNFGRTLLYLLGKALQLERIDGVPSALRLADMLDAPSEHDLDAYASTYGICAD